MNDRHSCLNLYHCVIKYNQSINQSISHSLSFSLSLSLCADNRAWSALGVSSEEGMDDEGDVQPRVRHQLFSERFPRRLRSAGQARWRTGAAGTFLPGKRERGLEPQYHR